MDILLLVVLALLLVWMFFSSRRRQQKMREEQARKAELMVPGARVMTRSGLFGTLVEFDKDDLSAPAKVEIAPGVVVELHTQAIDLAPEETAVTADDADADVADADAADTRDADATLIAEPEPVADDTKPGSYTINGAETDELPGSGSTPDKRDDKNA